MGFLIYYSNYTIKRISQPCKLGEAPFWDHQKNRLYFVDINGQTIFSYHQDSGEIYNAKISMNLKFCNSQNN